MRAALKHLLTVLRKESKIPEKALTVNDFIQEELTSYDTYLHEVCGLAKSTRTSRVNYAKKFLAFKFTRSSIEIGRISTQDLQEFVTQYGKGFKPLSIQCIAVSLRSYLRYRAQLGDHTNALIAAIPSIAQWRLATLPKALSASEVKQILDSFNRSTAIGRRDFAIARCLLDLGLRAGEVAALQIDDIDWHNSTLLVRSAKSHRTHLLPLPTKTGEAIVDYLCQGRPAVTCRSIFVRHRGPVNSAMNGSVISGRIRIASSRRGIVPTVGAHICRHTAACNMLKAGASLKGIADILRHRCLDTVMIYAKIDLGRLNRVISPWPGKLS